MILWLIIPIVLYFFKIDISIVITILTVIDFFRGKSLLKKYLRPDEVTTYYDEEGIIRWLPENKWFINGMKHIFYSHINSIPVELLGIIYKIFLILCYFEFDFYFKDYIIFESIFLIISTYLGWILGEIIGLREILKMEKLKKNKI